MAMVRAALAGGPFRSCPYSLLCLRHSRLSSSAVVISTEDYADKAEHTKEPGAEPWAHKGHTELVGSFLKEQRRFFNELLCHLKDQRVLLDSTRKELGLQKAVQKALIDDNMRLSEDISSYFYECNTRKEVAMNAVSTNNAEVLVAEQSEKNSDQESSVVSDSSSGNGVPIVLSEEESKRGGSIVVKEAGTKNFQHPSWPEWTTFLNHLRPYASDEKSKEDFELFEDTTILKRAIVKFAQAHERTFRSLSRKDLHMLVQHAFPSMDEKTAAGKKKLDNYLKASSRGNNLWNNKVPQVKLTDVVRLVYRAVRSMPALGGALPSDLNSAIIHILQGLNSASTAQHNSSISTPAATSQTAEGSNQLTKVDEDKTCGDISRRVNGEASPHERNASIEHDDSTSTTRRASNFLDLPRFGSLKERVDAKRARLARESWEKEAAKSQLPEPLSIKELNSSPMKKNSITVERTRDECLATRNFEAFDAIIKSDDIDDCERSKTLQKPTSEFRSPLKRRK